MKSQQIVVAVVVLLIIGMILPSPRCGRGCKNLLQHIAQHELGNLIAALLA